MFAIQHYSSFIAAILIFQMAPGPGTLAILNATARNGVRAGLGAVAGTLSGDFVYMLSAAVGLAAVIRAYPIIFQALQWFGAAYLCWIGYQLIRSNNLAPATREERKSARVYFRQAFAVSLTNPKVVLFFVAFFPLFMSAGASTVTLIAMMAHVTLLSLLYQTGMVLVGNAVARRLAALPSARKWATRLAGCALIGFGLKLAASNR